MVPQDLPGDLSDKELKWGYWYVSHYTKLHKIAWWLFIILTVAIWVYVIFGVVRYVWETPQFEKDLRASVQEPPAPLAIKAAQAARPLEVQGVYAVPGASGTLDLLAIVQNPNASWSVPRLQYEFTLNGQPVGVESTFLLPNERRALLRLKVPGGAGVADIVLHPEWRRLRDPARYVAPKFTAGPVQFIPAHTPLSDRPAVPFSQAIFTLTNDAPFAWWLVPVTVVGRSGGSVTAVGQVMVDKFLSQEKRLLTVSWSEPLTSPGSFEIFPAVDSLDSHSYFKAL